MTLFGRDEIHLGSGTKDLERVSADKAIGVRSSWQSEKVAIQRKESSGPSNSFFTLCSSIGGIGGEKTRETGKPIIR